MNGRDRLNHQEHGWVKRSTDHIRNVPYLSTHYLMACPCGWGGWITKEPS